jgi:methylmalonyl-CoA mutase
LVPELIAAMKKMGVPDRVIVVGGVIPEQDYAFLYENGVDLIFGPGTKIPEAAQKVVQKIQEKKL